MARDALPERAFGVHDGGAVGVEAPSSRGAPRPGSSVCGCAQAGDRVADDARGLHLRDADASADLRWVRSSSKRRRSTSRSRGVIARSSWASVARSSARPKPCSVLATVSPSVSPASSSAGARGLSDIARYAPEACSASSTCSSVAAAALRDLRHGGLAVQVAGQLDDLLVHAQRQLLQAAGHAHRPRAVAEVAPDLAQDGRHGVAGERDVAAEVEAIDRLDEPQTGDLEEIVEGLPAALVAARQPAREGQEALHEPVTVDRVAPLHIALKQRPVGAQAPRIISSRTHRGTQLSLLGIAVVHRNQRSRQDGGPGAAQAYSHITRAALTRRASCMPTAPLPRARTYGLTARSSPNTPSRRRRKSTPQGRATP